jgi:CheY-like chemotaxis protein
MEKNKILIIDDDINEYLSIASRISHCGDYYVVPSVYTEMNTAFNGGGESIKNYVDNLIINNYKDIRLVICDLNFRKEIGIQGFQLIEYMRKISIESCPHYIPLLPIMAYTNYMNDYEPEKIITEHGASFCFKKPTDEQKNNTTWIAQFNKMIETHVTLFSSNLTNIEKLSVPANIQQELEKFKKEHGGKKTAFIMTPFSDSHKDTIEKINEILQTNNIIGHIANAPGGENHDNLLPNIQVFLHGCDFGIGIYSNVSDIGGVDLKINPNLSLEVGYMLALQKKVGLLKDNSLPRLNSDLDEKLYIPFNIHNPVDLKEKLEIWLKNKGFITR